MDSNIQAPRDKIDLFTDKIIDGIKFRQKYFPLNSIIYQKDAIPIKGRTGISLFEYSIEGLEEYHAKLGRFLFPDQRTMTNISIESRVERIVPASKVHKREINALKEIILVYPEFAKKLYLPGDNPEIYGETAYRDADIASFLLSSRMCLGTEVAESKSTEDPSILELEKDSDIIEKLRRPEREKLVLGKARAIARGSGLDLDVIEELFKWMISTTIKVEVEYLRQKQEKARVSQPLKL